MKDNYYNIKESLIEYDFYYLNSLNIFNKEFYSIEEINLIKDIKDKKDLYREFNNSKLTSLEFLSSLFNKETIIEDIKEDILELDLNTSETIE